MRLSFNFTVLLAALLYTVSLTEALPVARTPGLITLPIRALHAEKRSDVHPHVFHQQQVNRALKRHALMAGAAMPSDLELREKLEKRLYILGEGAAPLTGSKATKRSLEDRQIDSVLAKLAGARRDDIGDIIKSLGLDPNDPRLAGIEGLLGQLFGNGDGQGSGSGSGSGHHHKNGGGSTSGSDPSTSGSDPSGSSSSDPVGNDPTADPNASDPTSSGNDPTASGSDPTGSDSGSSGSGVALGGLTPGNTPTDNDSLALDIEGEDTGYVAVVSIGTPPRDFRLLMDSGSADLWVGSENCQSQQGGNCGNNHVFLGSQSSSSFKDTGSPFSVTYGSGNVAGDIVQDDLTIAGLTLKGHTFGVANSESVDFADTSVDFDGLMGLAQSTLSEQKTATPVEALASAGLIPEAITSYKISRLADNKNDGEITFGGLDSSKFDASSLVTIPNVNQQGFWEAGFSITVGGQDLGLSGRTAILDTGTTLIIAPQSDAEAFHKQIPGSSSDGQGNFIIPCTGLPAVSFNFGGTDFTIDPRDLVFSAAGQQNGQCQSSIAGGQIGGPQEWLVGDVFLKNAYYSTDVGKNTISLAKLV